MDDGAFSELARELREVRPPTRSEEELVRRFAAENHGRVIYVNEWGKWFIYDGTRWVEDKTASVKFAIRLLCAGEATKAMRSTNNGAGRSLAMSKTVNAVENLAKCDPKFATKADDLDRDDWALNTPDGTINLRTGKIKSHDPADLITKTTTVGPEGGCPVWLEFLDCIMRGNVELIRYLQRACGYALTGSTDEQCIFFFYGTGANGKSTFTRILQRIAGDYARTAPAEMFTIRKHQAHLTELARLAGARIVGASELNSGEKWNEQRIKSVTGGEPIVANFMRQDHFEYIPKFKLIFSANDKPTLNDFNEAMKRRIHLVPFEVTIPENERDPALFEKLKAEAPGILTWMLDGLVDWRENGLAVPEIVANATADYFEEEDVVGRWLKANCTEGDFVYCSELISDFRTFEDSATTWGWSQRRLTKEIERRGYQKHKRKDGVGFLGLRLATAARNPVNEMTE